MADSDKGAEFAFDLFSDIAPLLSLFGDQFVRQFASESLTWVDHLIFAMVPLGILTAITGAIRVQGSTIAKSFIGRDRENRALAEIELMSSTSKEVCELFNGKSIIRAMGRPKLAQMLVYPLEYEKAKDNNANIDSQRLSRKSADTNDEIKKAPLVDNEGTEAAKPAVSINFRNSACGIHTFETATFDPGPGPKLLDVQVSIYSKSEKGLAICTIGLSTRIKGKWTVEIGVIDAILSLWMASIEAEAANLRKSSDEEHANSTSRQKSETPNWRRRKLGIDLRYDFRRILGDDFKDGTMKRDLSRAAVAGSKHEDTNPNPAESGFLPSSARLKADTLKLVIGYNGLTHRLDPRRSSLEEGRKELAPISTGLLPNVLAQHLFTNFMWTVVGQLPEDFQQLVNFGIGTQDEILLCMIPAFSSKDLLPNHVILKLIPQVRLGQGWAETARCYNRLLEQSMRVTYHETIAEEKFCYNVLVATVDFLIFASEPYDGHISPPQELILLQIHSFNEYLVPFLFLEKTLGFSKTYKALYEALSGTARDEPMVSTRAYQFQVNMAKARDIFDWTPLHYAAFLDSSYENQALLARYFDPKDVKKDLSIHRIAGPFGRSPLHMVAISRSFIATSWVSKCLGTKEDKRNAYTMAGIDGMTPVHLATKSDNVEMVGKIIDKKRMRTTTTMDFWRRSAIHLATHYDRVSIISVLLREDSQIDNADEIGMTPLEYLFESGGESQIVEDLQYMSIDPEHTSESGALKDLGKADAGTTRHEESDTERGLEDEDHGESDKSGAKPIDGPQKDTVDLDPQTSEDKQQDLVNRKQENFVEIASKRLDYHDDRDGTLLYYAIEHTNIETIGQLISRGYKLESKDAAGLTRYISQSR
ncbi:hypothetical protein E8E11_011412 [Didymella keratinophila]|nr:hypothetical protein E8E11_011412 [Didymella keratinophila]